MRYYGGVDDWVIMSSGTLYLNVPKYNTLPGDFDLVIRDKDFSKIHERLKTLYGKGEIQDLKLYPIVGEKRVITDPKKIQSLLAEGNLKIAFFFPTKKGVLMDAELFAEAKGKGLTQLGTIPRVIEVFNMNGKEIKTSGLFDLTDTYIINLMDEIGKNSVFRYGEKAKDAARVYNLTYYLREAGLQNPRRLMDRIDKMVATYEKYAGKDLSPYLK